MSIVQKKVDFTVGLLTERILLDCRFLGWINEKTGEPIYRRAHIEHNPRAYWDNTDVFSLSIYCGENHHGDYYLHLSKTARDLKWFCFLINGRWSETFIHLRHIEHFGELQEIVWALTRCNLFPSEYEMKKYCTSLTQTTYNDTTTGNG